MSLAAAGLAGPISPVQRPRGYLGDERIDQLPKHSQRPINPFMKGIKPSGEKPWAKVPDLSKLSERGFDDSKLWQRLAQMPKNITYKLDPSIDAVVEWKDIGDPTRIFPSELVVEKPITHEELMMKCEKFLFGLSADVLFGAHHPLVKNLWPRKLTAKECLILIERMKDVDESIVAVSILHYMRAHRIPRSIDHYQTTLVSSAINARMDIVNIVMRWMEADGFSPDDPATASIKVLALGMAGINENATKAFEIIKATGGKPTAQAYKGMLNTCAFEGNIDRAEALRAEMAASGYEEDGEARRILLRVYAICAKPDKVEALLAAAPEDFDGDPETYFESLIYANGLTKNKKGILDALYRSRISSARVAPSHPSLQSRCHNLNSNALMAPLSSSVKIHNAAILCLGDMGAYQDMLNVLLSMRYPNLKPLTRKSIPRNVKKIVDEEMAGLEAGPLPGQDQSKASLAAVRDTETYITAIKMLVKNDVYPIAEHLRIEAKSYGINVPTDLEIMVKEGLEFDHDIALLHHGPITGEPPPTYNPSDPLAKRYTGMLLWGMKKDAPDRAAFVSEVMRPLEEGGWDKWKDLGPNATFQALGDMIDSVVEKGIFSSETGEEFRSALQMQLEQEQLRREVIESGNTWIEPIFTSQDVEMKEVEKPKKPTKDKVSEKTMVKIIKKARRKNRKPGMNAR